LVAQTTKFLGLESFFLSDFFLPVHYVKSTGIA
jgi:hypothetical protein